MLLRQTQYLQFERKLWETITFCILSAEEVPFRGRTQSLDGCTDVTACNYTDPSATECLSLDACGVGAGGLETDARMLN